MSSPAKKAPSTKMHHRSQDVSATRKEKSCQCAWKICQWQNCLGTDIFGKEWPILWPILLTW